MKIQISSTTTSLLLGGVVLPSYHCDSVFGARDDVPQRWLQEVVIGNTACLDCFDKIDLARDCLRECNQKAYPGDNCCCCCKCKDTATLVPGGSYYNIDINVCNYDNKNNNNNIYNIDYGGNSNQGYDFCNDNRNTDLNCQFYNDNKNKNNNKWYNDDKYCKCNERQTWDQNDNNNNRNYCDGNQDDNDTRQKDSDRSLLDFCLEENNNNAHTVESINDLNECCDFDDNQCDVYFEQVQECLITCINPCLTTTAGTWLDCIRDNGDEQGGCSRQDCLDGFLVDEPKALNLDDSPDLFDLKTINHLVQTIDVEDLQDCNLLTDFVSTTCGIGNSCCNKCQTQLGSTVDCLINDIVIPFAAGQLNMTIEECPINTEQCKAEFQRRQLFTTPDEAETFHRVMMDLPPLSSMDKKKNKKSPKPYSLSSSEASASSAHLEVEERHLVQDDTMLSAEEEVAVCQRTMEVNILAHNMTYASSKFMQCIMSMGVKALPDNNDQAGQQQGSMASSLSSSVFATFGLLLLNAVLSDMAVLAIV